MKAQQAPPDARQVWLGITLLKISQSSSGGIVLYASHRIRIVRIELNQLLNRFALTQPSGPSASAGGLTISAGEGLSDTVAWP